MSELFRNDKLPPLTESLARTTWICEETDLTKWKVENTVGAFIGKRKVITGASRGVGFEAAKLFLADGAEVFGTVRDKARLESSAAILNDIGVFQPFLANLSSRNHCRTSDCANESQVASYFTFKFLAIVLLLIRSKPY